MYRTIPEVVCLLLVLHAGRCVACNTKVRSSVCEHACLLRDAQANYTTQCSKCCDTSRQAEVPHLVLSMCADTHLLAHCVCTCAQDVSDVDFILSKCNSLGPECDDR